MKNKAVRNQERKRGLRASLAVHAGLVLLALLPFLREMPEHQSDDDQLVEIEFVNGEVSSNMGSTAPEEVRPIEKPAEKEITEKKVMELKPESKEILTDEVQEEILVEDKMSDEAEEVLFENEEEQKIENEDMVEEVVEEEVLSEEGSTEDSEAGEGDEGQEISGEELGTMDFDGEGVFGRRVIYRADVKKITEREGTVVVNLCINRTGQVTHAAFNKDNSTIREPDYVRRAMDVASDYLFEKDYTAPATQCGKLTFIFHIE